MPPITEEQSNNVQSKTLTFNKVLRDFMHFRDWHTKEEWRNLSAKRFIETFSFREYRNCNEDFEVITTNLLLLFRQPNTDRSLTFNYFNEEQALKVFDWVVMDYNREHNTIVITFVNLKNRLLTMVMYDSNGLISIGYNPFD